MGEVSALYCPEALNSSVRPTSARKTSSRSRYCANDRRWTVHRLGRFEWWFWQECFALDQEKDCVRILVRGRGHGTSVSCNMYLTPVRFLFFFFLKLKIIDQDPTTLLKGQHTCFQNWKDIGTSAHIRGRENKAARPKCSTRIITQKLHVLRRWRATTLNTPIAQTAGAWKLQGVRDFEVNL